MEINLSLKLTVISPYGRKHRATKDRITKGLYQKSKGKCRWCKIHTSIKNDPNHPIHATADHVYSKNDIRRALNDSVVLACRRCNSLRNDKEVHSSDKDYTRMCFLYLKPFLKTEFTYNGKFLINDMHHDKYFDSLSLMELIILASLNTEIYVQHTGI